jgi:hypothetical protein
MKLPHQLSATLFVLTGAVFGMLASDVATNLGVTHCKYAVEFKHELTRTSDMECTRKAVNGGINMSAIDSKTMAQSNCLWVVYGHPNADGSFSAYRGWESWVGRYQNRGIPMIFKAAEIQAIHRFEFDPFPWIH